MRSMQGACEPDGRFWEVREACNEARVLWPVRATLWTRVGALLVFAG